MYDPMTARSAKAESQQTTCRLQSELSAADAKVELTCSSLVRAELLAHVRRVLRLSVFKCDLLTYLYLLKIDVLLITMLKGSQWVVVRPGLVSSKPR